jgi:7,8-dihydroneopterin aldolase/epimerase/oxygenase
MITIRLKDLKIHAGHGVYQGEALVGNSYQVDLWVRYPEKSAGFESLHETVDYEELFGILKQRMARDTALLEKLCSDVLTEIKSRFPQIIESEITVYKLQAAIHNLEGKVGVTLYKKFDDQNTV